MSIQMSPAPASTAGNRDRQAYLHQLLDQRLDLQADLLNSPVGAVLQARRDQAAARLQTLAIPSTRDEEWRFTDLSGLLNLGVEAAPDWRSLPPLGLSHLVLPEAINSRLVFVDGIFAPQLSAVELPEGIALTHLANPQLPSAISDRLSAYLAQQPGSEEVFTTLNTASLTDAAVLWIDKNVAIEQVVHLLFVSTSDRPIVSQPRCLVVAEPNSSVTIVEEFAAIGDGAYFTNSVTEIWLHENAQVNHTRLQRDSLSAFHVGKTAVTQARDSRYACHAVILGAGLSRHNLEIFHTGEQVETALNGLTLIAGKQIADTHSTIAYAKPHGSSRQVHKCIVDDRAHAIFNGKVHVPQAAQLTDAQQLNRNLLLSSKARVDTKPQLEIVADNVKCTHGATVSQLDADELFYFQSRGIDAEQAQKLLIYAFAYEILKQIPIASLRDRLSSQVIAQTR